MHDHQHSTVKPSTGTDSVLEALRENNNPHMMNTGIYEGHECVYCVERLKNYRVCIYSFAQRSTTTIQFAARTTSFSFEPYKTFIQPIDAFESIHTTCIQFETIGQRIKKTNDWFCCTRFEQASENAAACTRNHFEQNSILSFLVASSRDDVLNLKNATELNCCSNWTHAENQSSSINRRLCSLSIFFIVPQRKKFRAQFFPKLKSKYLLFVQFTNKCKEILKSETEKKMCCIFFSKFGLRNKNEKNNTSKSVEKKIKLNQFQNCWVSN